MARKLNLVLGFMNYRGNLKLHPSGGTTLELCGLNCSIDSGACNALCTDCTNYM